MISIYFSGLNQTVMNKEKYVFAQLIQLLNADKYVKNYTCWNQLLTLMYEQLSNRESLHMLIVVLEAHSRKLYHLGMGKSVTLSNLSKANERRDYRIFEEFAFFMIGQARCKRQTSIFKLGGNVYAFDSTTIDLCLSVFEWAKFQSRKGGIKMHTLYDIETQVPVFVHITPDLVHDSKAMPEIPYEPDAHYIFDRGYNDFANLYKISLIGEKFVLRAKTNVRFKPQIWKRRLPSGIVSDAIGHFTVCKGVRDYPELIRKVICIDLEDGTRYIFLTNNLETSPQTISLLYRNRWSVELFFKWIKQHLKIKKFWGTSENAVRIQIYCAIITYCLVAIVQHDMQLERSIYEVLQILGISLTDKTHLRNLFDKSNIKNVNDLYGFREPNLFNFNPVHF